jgi:hypothetical protein
MNDRQQQDNFFRLQFDVLMKEVHLIDSTIDRLDEIMLRNRNWGITLWAGLIAIILKDDTMKHLILATAIIPLLFWLIDIRWKMALLQCSGRQERISFFLNNELKESFETGHISAIDLLDPTGKYLPIEDRPTFFKALAYKDTPIFFPVQILGSLVLFFLVNPL